MFKRGSGILMHITSLGGRYGIGSIGQSARLFADFLHGTQTRYWQILPFNPILKQFGYSPYASTSTFAGNALFIDPDDVKKQYKFITESMLPECIEKSDFVNYELVEESYNQFFSKVFHCFSQHAADSERLEFHNFCEISKEWLDDYALYMVLSDIYATYNWKMWPVRYASRAPEAITEAHTKYANSCQKIRFIQFLFFKQWAEFKEYCKKRDVVVIGDIPIYVSFDSADAWARPYLFLCDDNGTPDPVAGVPPDYFSQTGQRWGNPIYKWHKDGKAYQPVFQWWLKRVEHLLKLCDIIRIDHFRAFESFWAIPQHEVTAVVGSWEQGPGEELFKFLLEQLGELPFIAEDLGIITEKVRLLRKGLNFPGMRILQFAFDFSSDNHYLPHSITDINTILYTGTHDNNTSNGWYYEGDLTREMQEYVKEYLSIKDDSDFHRHFIKAAFRSPAIIAIIPLQDLLGYSEKFRMNQPGTMDKSNWRWQLSSNTPLQAEQQFLLRCNIIYNRNYKKNDDQIKNT